MCVAGGADVDGAGAVCPPGGGEGESGAPLSGSSQPQQLSRQITQGVLGTCGVFKKGERGRSKKLLNRFKKIKSLDLIRSKNSKKNNKLFDKNSKPKIGNQW